MEFAEFAERAAAIEDENADLEITALVTELLRDAGSDLAVVSRFVQGRVFPAWESTTLDVGPSLCHAAIARAAGQNVTASDVEDRLAETGEIGTVAASYDFGGQQGITAFSGGTDDLTVREVDDVLQRLADTGGTGSQDAKLDALFGLFNRCSPIEARYLARLVLSEMRIGVGEGTVRDAIAACFDVPVDAVERALQVSNDYGLVAETARRERLDGLEDVHLVVGRPIRSMLAQTGTVTDAIAEWGTATVEVKFDGARVQAHYDGEGVELFSRNMEDVTDALPEIVEFVGANCAAPAILDGEAVAVDDDGRTLPFQEVLRRFRRKHDVEAAREEVALRVHFFDCLHADGEDLLDHPLRERRKHLDSVLHAGVSEQHRSDDPEEIEAIEDDALAAGHEGIMLKNPDSAYTPGRRGKNWLKRKPDVETLDCVVTGAEWGEGRRATLLGTFRLSLRDGDGFAEVGNVATGITDEELVELTELLEPHLRTRDGTSVDVAPAVVFEVGYEEIQRSPTYSSGYALRFPRFLGVRDDLGPADVDSVARIEDLADGQG